MSPVYHAYRGETPDGYLLLWCKEAEEEDAYWTLKLSNCDACKRAAAVVAHERETFGDIGEPGEQLALVAEGARGRAG